MSGDLQRIGPTDRLRGIGQVQGVAWMAMFGQAKMVEQMTMSVQPRGHARTVIAVGTVDAPCCNHRVRPCRGLRQIPPVVAAFRVGRRAHFARICSAQGKDVDGLEAPVPQSTGALFTSLDRGIVLYLGRGGRIEHDERDAAALGVPNARQAIAKPLAR